MMKSTPIHNISCFISLCVVCSPSHKSDLFNDVDGYPSSFIHAIKDKPCVTLDLFYRHYSAFVVQLKEAAAPYENRATIITESHTALNQLDKFKPNLLNKWIYSAMSRNQTPTEMRNASTESPSLQSQLRTND